MSLSVHSGSLYSYAVNQAFNIYLHSSSEDPSASVHLEVYEKDTDNLVRRNGNIYSGPLTVPSVNQEIDEGMDLGLDFTFGPLTFNAAAAGKSYTLFFQVLENSVAVSSCEFNVDIRSQ